MEPEMTKAEMMKVVVAAYANPGVAASLYVEMIAAIAANPIGLCSNDPDWKRFPN